MQVKALKAVRKLLNAVSTIVNTEFDLCRTGYHYAFGSKFEKLGHIIEKIIETVKSVVWQWLRPAVPNH